MTTTPDRYHAVDAEKALIGCLLLTYGSGGMDAYDAAIDAGVTAESFTDDVCRSVWTVAHGIATTQEFLDSLEIKTRAKLSSETYEKLIDGVPTATHAGIYADAVVEAHRRRQLRDAGKGLDAMTSTSELKAADIQAQHEAALFQMGERGPSDRETDAATHAARRGEFFEKALSGKSGILTGQQWLDLAFGGMIEGRLYVISGQPGCGKSSLCRNIADYAARSGNRVDFLTLEIMAQEVSAAICCARAGVSMLSLDAGRSRADLAKYNEAAKSFAGVPLFIQGGLYTPSKMFSWARRAVAKGSRLIVIDYIQRLGSDDPKANEEHRVACASEMALNIALKFNVPVLAVSSESNQGNLRHSGQITYDAAGWVRLKMADDKKTVMATFEKHRHGSAPGVTNLVFDQHGILTEVADY